MPVPDMGGTGWGEAVGGGVPPDGNHTEHLRTLSAQGTPPAA